LQGCCSQRSYSLSSDAYLKFIEDDFLHDFDFDQNPRSPVILPLHPPYG
jgi:hypothetical protein